MNIEQSAFRSVDVSDIQITAYGPADTTSHDVTHVRSGSMSLMVTRDVARELISAWTKLLDETE